MEDMWESTVHQTDAEHEHARFQMTQNDLAKMSMAVDSNTASFSRHLAQVKDNASSRSTATLANSVLSNGSLDKLSTASKSQEAVAAYTTSADAKAVPSVRHRKEAHLLKLSSGLLNTYLNINEKYYASLKKRNAAKEAAAAAATEAAKPDQFKLPYEYKASSDSGIYDDKNCDYIIRIGEIWDNRYEVLKVLGRGSFGQVVEAYDAVHKENVAIKIIKNKRAFYQQALLEIRILQYLNANDKKDQNHIVRMKRHFEWRNHLCISYELLSMNLYELLRNQNFAGVSLNLVRKFAVQILTALRFLNRSDISIVHCDLKPENIVLKNSKRSALKLIDFGSSCFSNQKTYSYIQSRFYRSPEVLLGVPYQTSIDMWSLGCLLVEMHTGQPLFDGLTEHEQVCKLADVLGPPPTAMFSRACAKKRNVMYKQHSNGSYSIIPSKSFVPKQKSLNEVVKDKMYSIAAATSGSYTSGKQPAVPSQVEADYDLFLDLIRRMLHYDPDERIKPSEALEHPWLQATSPSMSAVYAEQAQSTETQDVVMSVPEAAQHQPLMKRVEKFTTGLSWSRKK